MQGVLRTFSLPCGLAAGQTIGQATTEQHISAQQALATVASVTGHISLQQSTAHEGLHKQYASDTHCFSCHQSKTCQHLAEACDANQGRSLVAVPASQ